MTAYIDDIVGIEMAPLNYNSLVERLIKVESKADHLEEQVDETKQIVSELRDFMQTWKSQWKVVAFFFGIVWPFLSFLVMKLLEKAVK